MNNRKRKGQNNNVNEKKIKYDWVAATETRNYVLNDCFIDYIEHSKKINIKDKFKSAISDTTKEKNVFLTYLFNKAISYEEQIYSFFLSKYGFDNVKNIGAILTKENKEDNSDVKYNETLRLLRKGTPIIYHGIVRNYKLQIHGIPDFIIKGDYLIDIMNSFLNYHNTSNVNKNKYYIVEIKFCKLIFLKDNTTISNQIKFKIHKTQLGIYSLCLGEMLEDSNYKSSVNSYIIGRGFNSLAKNIIGIVDLANIDKNYLETAIKAVKWIRLVKNEGHTWDLTKLPFSRSEIYPNMCNKYDYPYHELKKAIADDIGEISMLCYCGPKERNILHKKGIYSWNDPRCTPETLQIKAGSRYDHLKEIIKTNQSQDLRLNPRKILNNYGDWKKEYGYEIFVDFEMTCSAFDNLNESVIFLIGLYYNGEYIKFIAPSLTKEGENKICRKFIDFLDTLKNGKIRLYHWSPAETIVWEKYIKYNNTKNISIEWVDMLQIFKIEPITIKGCMNFSLKNIAKSMYDLGMIKTNWNSSNCNTGFDAVISVIKGEEYAKLHNIKLKSTPHMIDIVKYNLVDCKVLSDILIYLRQHHT